MTDGGERDFDDRTLLYGVPGPDGELHNLKVPRGSRKMTAQQVVDALNAQARDLGLEWRAHVDGLGRVAFPSQGHRLPPRRRRRTYR